MQKKSNIDTNMVDPLSKKIKEMEDNINEEIGPYKDLPKILLVGNTGAGKSSISCNLAGIPLQIKLGRGKKIILEGKGVRSGGQACTRQPNIIVDTQNRFILCDCPGFKDTAGAQQEIINSFIIDYLFQCDQNKENKFKVLLVASEAEINGARSKFITESFERISEMLISNRNFTSGIGIVITQTEPKITIDDYIERLDDNPTDELAQWVSFLRSNKNRLFLFPKPDLNNLNNLNENYTFPDHDKMIEFLTHDYLINPKHRITLGDSATREMENIQLRHSDKVRDIIYDLFKQITLSYQKEGKSENFEHWFKIMNNMISRKISNTHDLREFIQENIPNCNEYDGYFEALESYENFDSFINRALESDILTTYIEESVQACLREIVRELATLIQTFRTIEEQQSNLEKQVQVIATQQQQNEELQKAIKEQNEYMAKVKEANQALQNEIQDMKRRIEDKDREMQMQMMMMQQNRPNNGSALANLLGGFFTGALAANKIPFFNFGGSASSGDSPKPIQPPKK